MSQGEPEKWSPCPFCGAKDERLGFDSVPEFYVYCEECGATGPRRGIEWDDRKDKAGEQEEHICRLEWKLRDLGSEHRRVSELLAAAVARERELKMELEDLRMLAEDLLEDVVNSETIEFARMRARRAIKDYFK